jgi:holliday junction DNA helicase RuvA
MIGFVSGVVATKATGGCVVDVQGVGYRLACSATTLASLPSEGQKCKLWTHLYVREDALALFGFATEVEQRMFEALLTVSGVGPRVALAVCSAFSPDSFRRALATNDVAGIESVPGLGKKTAQRIIVDLKERLSPPDLQVGGSGRDTITKARSVLENLGYSAAEVRTALSGVTPSDGDRIEDIVKSALKALA